jgi:hypothetical protein
MGRVTLTNTLNRFAGTVTRGLCRFAPNFSPRITAPYVGVGMTPFVNPERALP